MFKGSVESSGISLPCDSRSHNEVNNMSDQHQKDLQREIETLLRTKTRNIGDSTKTRILAIHERIADYMMHGDGKNNPGLQTIWSLRPRHIESYIAFIRDEWRSKTGKEMKPGAVACHLTELRHIAKSIGKENIVKRDNATYMAGRGERNNPITMDVANYNRALERMTTLQHGAWATVAKITGDAIGLRRREQLLTKDVIVKLEDGTILVSQNASKEMKEISIDGLKARYKTSFGNYVEKMVPGQLYAVVEGAKTGQRRSVPLNTEEKRTAMEARMAYIRDSGHKSIMPAGLSLAQALNAFKNCLQRAGFTKENGCNPHAARHHYAQQEVAGGRSRWDVSLSMGHHRISIISAYVPKAK